MSKWTKNDILKKTAGVKIHKSFREAMNSTVADLEKQHFEILGKLKAKAKPKPKGTR